MKFIEKNLLKIILAVVCFIIIIGTIVHRNNEEKCFNGRFERSIYYTIEGDSVMKNERTEFVCDKRK